MTHTPHAANNDFPPRAITDEPESAYYAAHGPEARARQRREREALFADRGGRLVRLLDVGLIEEPNVDGDFTASPRLLLYVNDGKRSLMLTAPLSEMTVLTETTAETRLTEAYAHAVDSHKVESLAPEVILCGLDPLTGVRYVRRSAMKPEWLALWDDGTGDDLIVCPHEHASTITPPHIPHA